MSAVREPSKSLFVSGGFFRGIAASKSLSSRGGLRHCGRIHHSDRIGSLAGMGIAELDIPLGGGAFTDRISHRIDSGLGLRCHFRRNSSYRENRRRNAPSAAT